MRETVSAEGNVPNSPEKYPPPPPPMVKKYSSTNHPIGWGVKSAVGGLKVLLGFNFNLN
jgi:hypothetical protein